MAGIKIVDLPAVGRDLASTDLLELSLAGGTGSRKITGQEIMNASKLSINNTPIINGTVGRVLFQGTGNVLQQSSSLFWDATNNRLGIGTSTPFWGLHYNVDGGLNVGMFSSYGTTSTFESLLYLFRSRGTSSAPSPVLSGDNLGSLRFAGQWGSSLNEYTTGAKIEGVATQNFSSSVNSARMSFYTTADGSNAIRENMRLFSSGNLLLQNGGTFTDAGFRLDVNGTFRALVSTETNPFVVQHTNGNSATIIIGNGSQLAAGQMGMYFNSSPIWTWNGSAFRLPGNIISTQNNPSTLLISGGWGGSTVGTSLRLSSNTGNQGVFTATSGTQSTVEIGNTSNETWSPSSGNATYNLLSVVPRINTTGTYSGIVRGIIYAPTLTSVTGVTHRAIDLTSGDFVWGSGYSQYYGNSVEGFIQFTTSGTTSQLWMRPSGNQNNYNSNYWSRLENNNGNFNIYGSNYSQLLIASAAGGGNGARIFFSGSTGIANNSLSLEGPSNSGRIALTTYSSSPITLNGGNVLIGTTTDAGFKLDVNGTARVDQTLQLNGTGTATLIAMGGNIGRFTIDGSFIRFKVSGGGDILNMTTNFFGVNETSVIPSAICAMTSTNRGFLPPRMTQAQRNAIASPAIGLEIYQTDATEGKYIYKSSGWTYIG